MGGRWCGTQAELVGKMDWLLQRGVRSISLWAGAPTDHW